jgi:hypothetical protein
MRYSLGAPRTPYCAWYEGQRIGLVEEFLAEIRRASRRALLHKFPYGLFYRVI